MSRIAPISYRKLVRVLELEGFRLARERGNHMIFTKENILRLLQSHDPTRFPSSSSRTYCARRRSAGRDTWSFWSAFESFESMPMTALIV
jgi:predicted RNA binding protein YcfA (HicA-like mRNA interferase family)